MNRSLYARPTPLLWLLTLLTALVMAGLLAAPSGAAGWITPPPPTAALSPDGIPGTIYYGATPPGGGQSKPVLLFVHGKNGEARTWWTNTAFYGRNDMYDYAYNYGYRTAFVDLLDSNGGGATMWANGQLLRTQIDAIAAHYGVSALNVIGHSKGGIDAQAAVVHYGAGPRVQKLFTLSSPHWGSPLADLAYSIWTWWLAALLGERNDGTYVVQTGYMNYFRSVTDNRPENSWTHYYTGGGTSWGPLFSDLWFAGSYLNFYGSNDGLVPANSARNPLGTAVFTRSLDHDSVRLGHTVFPTVDTYVRNFWRRGDRPAAPEVAPKAGANPDAVTAAGSILRGGMLASGTVTGDQVTVEPGATHLALDLLSNVAGLDVVWTAPTGARYPAKVVANQGEDFRGATHYVVDVAAPAAGAWQMVARTPAGPAAAYLLAANISSPLAVTVNRDPALTFTLGSALPLTIEATDATGRQISGLQVRGTLRLDDGPAQPFALQPGAGRVTDRLLLPTTPGIANLSLTITGRLSDGSAFERELATSVAVVAPGTLLPLR